MEGWVLPVSLFLSCFVSCVLCLVSYVLCLVSSCLASCLLPLASCLLSLVSCLLSLVSCLLSLVSCLLCLLSLVSCLLPLVSCLLSLVSCPFSCSAFLFARKVSGSYVHFYHVLVPSTYRSRNPPTHRTTLRVYPMLSCPLWPLYHRTCVIAERLGCLHSHMQQDMDISQAPPHLGAPFLLSDSVNV